MHSREYMYQKMDDSRNEVIQEATKNKKDCEEGKEKERKNST